MDYSSEENGARTNVEQSEAGGDFRVSFESMDFPERWELCRQLVERDRLAAKGDLYFIRAGRCVKIGHTINVVNRLAKMQADNHEKLDCLVILRGRGHEEPAWHERFERHHIRGEWFRWCPAIAEAVAEEREANVIRAREDQ